MTKILMDGFWNEASLSVSAIFEEIATIDRVIKKRIDNKNRAYRAGMIKSINSSALVDDLLLRRQILSDLAQCLMTENTWGYEIYILRKLTDKIAGCPAHPRWVG